MEQRTEEKLVMDNLGLVGLIVGRYDLDYNERDDFFQIGCIGLCKAAESFDRKKGIKFSSYAAPCIQNEINIEFRRRNGRTGEKGKTVNNPIYFGSPLKMHNDNEGLTVEDTISDEKQNIETKKRNR